MLSLGRAERLLGRPLYVRHAAAGAAVRVVRGAGEQWTLPPRRAQPITIRAVERAGGPARWSLVTIYLDDLRVPQHALQWLTGAGSAATGADGVWTWPNPPAGPVGVLVVRNEDNAISLAEQGALDGARILVPDPCSPVVEVRSYP